MQTGGIEFAGRLICARIESRIPHPGLNAVVTFMLAAIGLHQRIVTRGLKGRIRLPAKTPLLIPVEKQHRRHNGRADHQ